MERDAEGNRTSKTKISASNASAGTETTGEPTATGEVIQGKGGT